MENRKISQNINSTTRHLNFVMCRFFTDIKTLYKHCIYPKLYINTIGHLYVLRGEREVH